MGRVVSITVDPLFKFDDEITPFYDKCVRWARKLDNVLNGGVSVKFHVFQNLGGDHGASFFWNGKEITGVIFADTELTEENVWAGRFQPGVKEIALAERNRFDRILLSLPEVKWMS